MRVNGERTIPIMVTAYFTQQSKCGTRSMMVKGGVLCPIDVSCADGAFQRFLRVT